MKPIMLLQETYINAYGNHFYVLDLYLHIEGHLDMRKINFY